MAKGSNGEAYKAQAKAPKKGVKADDADEYVNKGIEGWNKEGNHLNQAKAPTGRGSRGPSQADGGPINGWDSAVKSSGGAYGAQEKWGDKVESGSLGFKPEGSGYGYLGHFAQDKNLRQGHNDSKDDAGLLSDISQSIRNQTGSPKDSPPPPPMPKGKKKVDEGSVEDFLFNDSKALHQDE